MKKQFITLAIAFFLLQIIDLSHLLRGAANPLPLRI